MQPYVRQQDLLAYVVKKAIAGHLVPQASAIASGLFRQYVKDAHAVVCDLRELEDAGLITGAPAIGSNKTHLVKPTAEGIRVAAIQAADVAEEQARPRKVNVIELRWRCVECDAVAIDARKPCPMCALTAQQGPEAIWFEPKQGAA